jgi:hypothetical protein
MSETLSSRRPTVRLVVLLILIGLGLRFIQIAAGDAPPAQAARGTAAVEGLGACGTPAGLGLYAPCEPRREASITWLQGQMAALGVLRAGEYLEPAAYPQQPTCAAEIRAADGAPAGWLCADQRGTYRIDLNTREISGRWQMWNDGTWREVR